MTDSAEPAPAPNEVELSIFGPGFGECVLVHLGDGEWMLVDSCFDQRRKEQPALAYLARMRVEIGQAVKVVVATHWHDDHVRRLAEPRLARSGRSVSSARLMSSPPRLRAGRGLSGSASSWRVGLLAQVKGGAHI